MIAELCMICEVEDGIVYSDYYQNKYMNSTKIVYGDWVCQTCEEEAQKKAMLDKFCKKLIVDDDDDGKLEKLEKSVEKIINAFSRLCQLLIDKNILKIDNIEYILDT